MDVRTTARIAAFIPGASPPDVKTPIFEIFASIYNEKECQKYAFQRIRQ